MVNYHSMLLFSNTWPANNWLHILVPRHRTPFGQHQESRLLAWSSDIPLLKRFVSTVDWDQKQWDLSDLTLSMRRVTGSLWIADFRCWTWPEVAILGADQKERGLWRRECCLQIMVCSYVVPSKRVFSFSTSELFSFWHGILRMRNWNHVLERKNGRTLPWAARLLPKKYI